MRGCLILCQGFSYEQVYLPHPNPIGVYTGSFSAGGGYSPPGSKPNPARKLEFCKAADLSSIMFGSLANETCFEGGFRMVRPDMQKGGQTTDDLRRLATEAAHPRTRERFLALFVLATR